MVSEASFFIYKSVLSHAMLLSEGLNEFFDDPNQSAHLCMSAQHEYSTKSANRLWKEQNYVKF